MAAKLVTTLHLARYTSKVAVNVLTTKSVAKIKQELLELCWPIGMCERAEVQSAANSPYEPFYCFHTH
jgi:hypothetical protein